MMRAHEDLVSINPATGEALGRVPVASAEEVRARIAALKEGAAAWRKTPLEERMRILGRVSLLIRERTELMARLMTREQGKPLRESRAEVANAAERLDYFCATAERALEPMRETLSDGTRLVTRFEPVGVVAAIKPWNFPVGIPLWTIGPALLAGNTVLFKPSERTPLLGEKIRELIREAGASERVFDVVHGEDDVGRAIVASDVEMIAFVGSQAAGREIFRESAAHLRRLVLELGGKDPMIVCADADLQGAVDGAVAGTFRNCGQVCCGVERIYVERPLFDPFLEAVVERVKRLRVGDGSEEGTEVGPMNREEEIRRVERHLEDAVSRGARVLAGGHRIGNLFFQPTVITDVKPDMLLAREETFGPVMSVAAVASVQEAVREANSTEFGLTASVWTNNARRGEEIARRLRAGTIAVNQTVGSIVQAPWGGVKKSGIGRMLGPEAAREFTETVNYRFPRRQEPVGVLGLPGS